MKVELQIASAQSTHGQNCIEILEFYWLNRKPLSSANQKANMKSRAARLKLSAFFATMGAIGWFLNEAALLSLGVAPLILWIVPQERSHASRARRANFVRWTAVIVFVGILWALGMAGG
jgi:hypothetical protein